MAAPFKNLLSPFALPIHFFGVVIAAGTLLLLHPAATHDGLSWVDALFTATSATCVTGLVVVDTGTHFTRFGHNVILGLIQLGGLGILTITSLFFYLLRQRVTLTDRVAVGRNLLHDPGFHLGRFLVRITMWTLIIEAVGALALRFVAPHGFDRYSALFHAVSAFCNAGFSLNTNSLTAFRGDIGVNLVFMALIILGGLGFSVLVELEHAAQTRTLGRFSRHGSEKAQLSWYSRVVIWTSLGLVFGGALALYGSEFLTPHVRLPTQEGALAALFQSVTCRTAGFNTLDIGAMSNVGLLMMIFLMFIGGSPGSTAGGIKTTTFVTLCAFIGSQFMDRRQTIVGRYALDRQTVNKALTLVIFAVGIVAAATLALSITEGGATLGQERGLFLDIFFETVSAFATVGLSTGLTPDLSDPGKLVVTALMFVGRLGPIVFLSALQALRQEPYYTWPEKGMLIG